MSFSNIISSAKSKVLSRHHLNQMRVRLQFVSGHEPVLPKPSGEAGMGQTAPPQTEGWREERRGPQPIQHPAGHTRHASRLRRKLGPGVLPSGPVGRRFWLPDTLGRDSRSIFAGQGLAERLWSACPVALPGASPRLRPSRLELTTLLTARVRGLGGSSPSGGSCGVPTPTAVLHLDLGF